MEDNCFTILCWFLPYVNMNQPKVCIGPLPPDPPSWVELPESHSRFPPAVCFQLVLCVFLSLPQSVPPAPSPAASTRLLSVSVFPLLPCRCVHQCHLPGSYMLVLPCSLLLLLPAVSLRVTLCTYLDVGLITATSFSGLSHT